MNSWKQAPDEPRIHTGEVHVWTFSTRVDDARLRHLEAALTGEERARAEGIRHATTHSGFVVTRAVLRMLLARYAGVGTDQLELRFSAKGKPALGAHHEVDLQFSVAHSGGAAMLAFARVDVGVDIERIREVPRERRLIARVFPEPTRTLLASLPASHRQAAFFAAWTQREALVKAVGGALLATRDPLDFVWPSPADPRRIIAENASGTASIWTVATLPQAAGFAATIVAAGEIDAVRMLPFDPS